MILDIDEDKIDKEIEKYAERLGKNFKTNPKFKLWREKFKEKSARWNGSRDTRKV